MDEEESFSTYGKNFQEKLAAIILFDRAFADRMEEVLSLDYFEYEYLQDFVEQIFSYKEEYGSHPSIDTVETLIGTELSVPEDIEAEIRSYFDSVKEIDEVEDEDFIKKQSLDFCRTQKVKKTFIDCAPLINESRFDEIQKNIKESLQKGSERDFGHIYKEDVEIRYEEDSRDPVSTGWSNIDEVMQGGHGSGELGTIMAPTGDGKSMCLVHLGAHAVQEGKTVVYLSLELSADTIGRRFDAWNTGISQNELYKHQDEITEAVQDIDGKLFIKKSPPNSMNPNSIRNYLERLSRNEHDVDMLLIDYADLLQPIGDYGAPHEELKSIYEELRAVADEFHIPVWTVSQTNREGVNKDKITKEEISESYGKCFAADLVIGLSRIVEQVDFARGKMFIAKNRNGPSGISFPVYFEDEYIVIEVEEKEDKSPNGESIEAEVEKATREGKKKLLDKYEKIKQKSKRV